jgi:hypothetical protein
MPGGLHDLLPQVDLVWHGVNDIENFDEFLLSPVAWAECDVRLARNGACVLHHDVIPPGAEEEALLPLASFVRSVAGAGRNLKVDLKERSALGEVLTILASCELADDRLWFNAQREVLQPDDFSALRSTYPRAILQCPIDDVGSRDLENIAAELAESGINRFSVAWARPHTDTSIDRLRCGGFDINLYGIADQWEFVDAVLREPTSVTADFNFPSWGHYGTGSGAGGRRHRSRAQQLAVASWPKE